VRSRARCASALNRAAERDAKQENGMGVLEAARVDLAAGYGPQAEKWVQSALGSNPELVPQLTELGAIRVDKADSTISSP